MCADLACGAITVDADHTQPGQVTWSGLRHENGYSSDDDLDLSAAGFFVFDAEDYRSTLLAPVAHLKALAADERAAETVQGTHPPRPRGLLERLMWPRPAPRRPAAAPANRAGRPPSPLIAVGAARAALAQLQWFLLTPGDAIPVVVGVASAVISVVAPAAMTLGVYLALRRLEDHLDGKRPDQAPTPTNRGPHALGLTRPYVITEVIGAI